ncbi:MAG: hypothetical protein IKA36_00450, partial [Clostridia bacterium]|nr:hypothetical protein [Clostridia bacterium]
MELPTPEKIEHAHMMDEYVNMQTEFICRQTGKSREEVLPIVQQIAQDRYKPRKVTFLKSPSYGNVVKTDQ